MEVGLRVIVFALFLISFFLSTANAHNDSVILLFDDESENNSISSASVTSPADPDPTTSSKPLETNVTILTTTTTTTTTQPEVTTTRRKRKRVTTATPRGNANDLMDHMLIQWRKQIVKEGYDPLYVPRVDQKGLTCWNCVVVGLATIHRTGDVTMQTNGSSLALEADMGVEELKAQCLCEARVFVLSLTGKIKLHMVGFSMVARLEQENTPGSKAEITKLEFKPPGHFGTFFEGKGFLGMMAEWFGQNFIKDTIKRELFNADTMKQLINQGLGDVNIFEQMQTGFF